MLELIDNFITRQHYLIFFVYGLVYFVMGCAILLQSKEYSSLSIAPQLWLLGAFGLTHGLADWAPLFIPLEEQFYGPGVVSDLWSLYLSLLVLSFIFLFYFGLNLLFPWEATGRWFRAVPMLLLGLWLIIFFQYQGMAPSDEIWRYYGSTWARYLLALPASLLTAVALRHQFKEAAKLGSTRLLRCLRNATAFLLLYALVSGLVVPPQPFFPASWLNTASFKDVVGLPIQLLRTLVGIGIAYSIIRYLDIFNLETRLHLEEARQQQALLEERERISRDIHDGTLQSLYGLGLRLEHCHYLLQDLPGHPAREHLAYCTEKLNQGIKEIRSYISDMHHYHFKNKRLIEGIHELIDEFHHNTGLRPEMTYREDEPLILTPLERENIFHLVKEALNNVAKHARAKSVRVELAFQSGVLRVDVEDNGCGFNPGQHVTGCSSGLHNMRSRAEVLGGVLRIASEPQKGTRVAHYLPLTWKEDRHELTAQANDCG